MKAVLMTSSILILLLAALRPVLRGRIDPRVQYALWLAAALRLLIPVNFVTSAYSALALLERGGEPPRIVQTVGQASVPIPAMSYEDAYDQALEEYHQGRPAAASFTDLNEVEFRARELQAQGPTVAELAQKLAKPVWLGGAALMAGWFLLVNASLRRKLKNARRLNGVDCPLPVYVSGALPSPCLCGVARPAIYVTPAALDDPVGLRHVLAHELTHYRHRDHWWALLRCVCLCLYWFDPLVWWAAALSRQDCELACDEGAIRALGEGERIPYGRTLVAMIAAGRNPLLQTATTMTGGKRKVKERVRLIARRPKTVVAVALALALIVAGAVGCTFTGAPEDSPEPDPSPSASVTPDTDRPALDTLRERLNTIPDDITGVKTAVRSVTDTSLVDYFLDMPAGWEDAGWLVSVCQWDQADFEDWLYSLESGAFDVFARDGEHYYAAFRPTSVEVEEQDYERWGAAQKAIGEYARQQVLDTEGVEPYDADQLRERESLWEGKTYTTVACWPYKNVTGSTDEVWIYRLVQLARDGEGGVWIPERVQYIGGGVDPTPQHVRPGEARGMTITEYADQLQSKADVGAADWALDPIQACVRYVDDSRITADCFTWDSAYIESVLEGLRPSEEQQAIQAVMDSIIAAPEISLTLAPGGTSRVYAYMIPSLDEWDENQGFWAYRLSSFATDFQWEKLDAPRMYATTLSIQPKDSPNCIWLWNNSNLVSIRTPDNRIEYYQAVSNSYGDPVGTSLWNPSPYGYLRQWFDAAELSRLRTTSVPDRGQSHEDVVNEWIEGFEGAMTKCAPGSQYACTYTRAENVQADAHSFMSKEDMDDFARSRGYSGDEYGKTWFTFSYELVFVPENENARDYMQAGNTDDYTGDDAPEGAQFWMRVAYMTLIDGNWVCEGIGTGW